MYVAYCVCRIVLSDGTERVRLSCNKSNWSGFIRTSHTPHVCAACDLQSSCAWFLLHFVDGRSICVDMFPHLFRTLRNFIGFDVLSTLFSSHGRHDECAIIILIHISWVAGDLLVHVLPVSTKFNQIWMPPLHMHFLFHSCGVLGHVIWK